MNKEIKTLGYLLTHYTDSQCYDQYIPLAWLKEQIEKRRLSSIDAFEHNYSHGFDNAIDWVLSLLEET